jgi:hypothetical protein
LSIFDNKFMRAYISKLNPRHQPPYCLERVRIVQVMIDYVMMEISRIAKERRSILGEAFASGSIDFWTDKHRKESFGAFVMDFLAPQYEVSVGNGISMNLFMSNETKARLDASMFIRDVPVLANLEAVLNFERFDEEKTCANVSSWMQSTTDAIKIQSSDFCQLVADGASNAIGSLAEHELLTRSTRENDVDFNVCMVHQNERSGGYASGTIKFATDPNPNLGAVLEKNHTLQV